MQRLRPLALVSFVLVLTSLLIAASLGSPLTATPVSAQTGFPPGPPQNVQAFAKDRGALVTWDAPISDGGSPITSYTVVTNTPGEDVVAAAIPPPVVVDGNTFEATVSGLTNGVTYVFDVFATNEEGDGPSATSNEVTPTRRSAARSFGEDGGSLRRAIPSRNLVGRVALPPGPAETDPETGEVTLAIRLTGNGQFGCPSAICLDVEVSPLGAYPATNPILIELTAPRTGPVGTRPHFKDDVLLPDCIGEGTATPAPACVDVRQRINNLDHSHILATSDDPKYRK
jgi:fibronectin type III domain protein